MSAAERIEAMGLAIPLPSISGADPCTLKDGVSPLQRGDTMSRYSRFTHHKVVTSVDRGDEAERPNERSGGIAAEMYETCSSTNKRRRTYEIMSP